MDHSIAMNIAVPLVGLSPLLIFLILGGKKNRSTLKNGKDHLEFQMPIWSFTSNNFCI